ncbi:MAG: cysteine desulfurase [Candidatus Hydrogenedentes bacterium]|nr:cysteine desulfurase [Candidatus Hydrogenedentota bacterium]
MDVERIRQDFPVLRVLQRGRPIAYLDNAATSQKPQQVIDAIYRYYSEQNANVHRGVHYLSQQATDLYEQARSKVAKFVGTTVGCEIVFTRGTTESINLVAHSYGRQHVKSGDEILISHMEHHSNIVPWQMLCEQTGAHLKVIPINDDGELLLDEFEKLLTPRTKIVSIVHVSNALGTINPVKYIVDKAHAAGAVVVVDGAQATPHLPVTVKELGCDFYALSGHKMYGPTGIGVLYGRAELLERMQPFQGGGDMILSVTFEKTTYNHHPFRFEAGTPHIEGAIGLGAAIDYLHAVGIEKIAAHEHDLLEYGTQRLLEVDGLRLIGTARVKAGVLGFTLASAHPHDVGQILDDQGVAVRAGHHCAQPVMQRFGVPATTRASFGMYNTREEIDRMVDGLHEVNRIFG